MESNTGKSYYISHKKLLIFGAESTGKSSLSNRLIFGRFVDNIEHTKESN